MEKNGTGEVVRDDRGRFKNGSASLGGRPLGSRHKFSETFLRDLSAKWAECGSDIIDRVAATEPAKFFSVAASLIPRDVQVSLTARLPGNLEPEEWLIATETFQAIRQALPEADKRQPGEVLSFVLDAIRAHDAKLIEAPVMKTEGQNT